MLEIRQAIETAFEAFRALPAELVGIVEARGRYLFEPIAALEDGPPFDASAMDGYALRAAELAPAGALPVFGESRAGGAWPEPLAPGAAMRIYTGAPLPAGADTVVAQEDVVRDGDRATFQLEPRRGQHVRAQGSDVRAGAPILAAGHAVRPASIALLASQGISMVSVHRRPVVSVLCGGDELRLLGAPRPPGTIVNSNLYALCAAIDEAGGIARPLPIAPDDERALGDALEAACESADVVLTTGGVSVGDHDYVRAAFARIGVTCTVPKVRMKPGKPVTVGLRETQPIVGLPGNPVSALVTFELFVRPGLRKMLGDPAPFPRLGELPLAAPHTRNAGRTELARAVLVEDAEGARQLRLLRDQGSASLRDAALADALAILPASHDLFEAGERVAFIDLSARTGSPRPPHI